MRLEIQKHIGNDELVDTTTLIISIIDIMHEHGEITMVTDEVFSAVNTGFVDVLDKLIRHYNWDRKKITLEYVNRKEMETITQFNAVMFSDFKSGTLAGSRTFDVPTSLPWNKEMDFGMFIGRLNFTRLCALDSYRNFKYKEFGITSMNQAPYEDSVNDKFILQYLKATDTKWADIKDLQPYSDLGEVIKPPIIPPASLIGWEKVYEKIAIEIICETNDSYGNMAITEKFLRCCLYKRPFLLIGSPGILLSLKTDYWHTDEKPRFFEDVIPLNYDNLYGKERVDAVFDLLANLISTGKINTILEDCKEDIEHNFKIVSENIQGLSNA